MLHKRKSSSPCNLLKRWLFLSWNGLFASDSFLMEHRVGPSYCLPSIHSSLPYLQISYLTAEPNLPNSSGCSIIGWILTWPFSLSVIGLGQDMWLNSGQWDERGRFLGVIPSSLRRMAGRHCLFSLWMLLVMTEWLGNCSNLFLKWAMLSTTLTSWE